MESGGNCETTIICLEDFNEKIIDKDEGLGCKVNIYKGCLLWK